MVSDPKLVIEIDSGNSEFLIRANGSGQAAFYHCMSCEQLLAVGANIAKQSKGAVNALVCDDRERFAKPIRVQPRLLSADEKVARWAMIWGQLIIGRAGQTARTRSDRTPRTAGA